MPGSEYLFRTPGRRRRKDGPRAAAAARIGMPCHRSRSIGADLHVLRRIQPEIGESSIRMNEAKPTLLSSTSRELCRRKVVRAGIACALAGWVVLQVGQRRPAWPARAGDDPGHPCGGARLSPGACARRLLRCHAWRGGAGARRARRRDQRCSSESTLRECAPLTVTGFSRAAVGRRADAVPLLERALRPSGRLAVEDPPARCGRYAAGVAA